MPPKKKFQRKKTFQNRRPQSTVKQAKNQAQPFKKPPLVIQPTTLWDYPSQHYGEGLQGDPNYRGATPSYVIWNLLQRYTKPKDLVVDPCAGSGTTLDVARELGRRALGYDVNPTRDDIFNVDARELPLEDRVADFVFIDPPYSTHLDYSDDARCIGKCDAASGAYYQAMERVIEQIHRVLKPGAYMGLYVSDSYVHNQGFYPIGFELFALLRKWLEPVDIVSVVRHNKTLDMGNYRAAAEEGNFFLRGFNYLFVMRKSAEKKPNARQPRKAAHEPAKRATQNKPRPQGSEGRRSTRVGAQTYPQPNPNRRRKKR